MKKTTMRKALPATALTVALAVSAISTSAVAASEGGATFYGSFRPVLETGDIANPSDPNIDDQATDLNDALTRIGFKGNSDLGNGLTGFFKYEVNINTQGDGGFGSGRWSVAGLKWGNSTLTAGRQRSINYLLVNEYVDIFNHRNSPFGLNDGSMAGFFVSDAITYNYSKNGFNLSMQSVTDGRSGDDDLDLASIGASYKAGPVYFAGVYNEAHDGSGDDVEQINLGVAADVGPVYLAVAYVMIERDAAGSEDTETLDVSAAMPLGNGYKIKLGYFDAELNNAGKDGYDGYNITLEKQLKNVRLHAELLSTDVDDGVTGISVADGEALAFGIRYDFSIGL